MVVRFHSSPPTKEKIMENYEALEGKIIDINDFPHQGKVVGCDYDIGITIVAADDPDNYLSCLQGASSPLKSKRWSKKRYDVMFNLIINQIKEGILNWKETDKIWNELTDGSPPGVSSVKLCPFAQ